MVADSGIERMSLVRDNEYSVSMGDHESEEEVYSPSDEESEEEGLSPGGAPSPKMIEMNKLAGLRQF
jgi:hypothetical protein